ncbi:MAG: D-2-hydroxyacid dehydrogenase [Dehalococcoidia bacterium]
MKVLINAGVSSGPNEGLSDAHINRIIAVSEELDVVVAGTPEEQEPHLADAEVILGRFDRNIFEKAKQLKVVMVEGAGVDNLLFDEFVGSDITLVSAKGTVGTHLADHAWALLLGLLRGTGRAVREKTWDIRQSIRDEAWEIGGKTLGIIGLGGTGVEVAKRAQAFDMDVIAVDPEEVVKPSFVREVWKPERFHDLLELSDVVVICCPLTKATRGMFNLEAFQHMRRHAILVNVTRGPMIDEASLIQALQQGLIASAGLDVTPVEPLPEGHPLWTMKNVIITPHTSGGSPLRLDRWTEVVCNNLKRHMEGRPLLGIIDKEKGY